MRVEVTIPPDAMKIYDQELKRVLNASSPLTRIASSAAGSRTLIDGRRDGTQGVDDREVDLFVAGELDQGRSRPPATTAPTPSHTGTLTRQG